MSIKISKISYFTLFFKMNENKNNVNEKIWFGEEGYKKSFPGGGSIFNRLVRKVSKKRSRLDKKRMKKK